MKRAAAGFHRSSYGRPLCELRIHFEYPVHVLTDGAVFKTSLQKGARHKIETAIFQGGIIQGHPDRESLPVRKRPERSIQVPGGRIGPGTFEQSLVMPDPDPVNTRQLRRHLSYPWVCHQFLNAVISLPEVDQLIEHFSEVIGIFVNAILLSCLTLSTRHLLSRSFADGGHHFFAPVFQFCRRQKIFYNYKTVVPVIPDLVPGQFVLHVYIVFKFNGYHSAPGPFDLGFPGKVPHKSACFSSPTHYPDFSAPPYTFFLNVCTF